MFKQLLSDNRIFAGLVCLLVFIAAGLFYLNRVKSQARRDVQRTQEIVEQLQTPTTERQTATGRHYHPDGTYHAEPHEAHTPSVSTTNPHPRGATAQTTGTQATQIAPAASRQPAKETRKTRYTPEQAAASEAISAKYELKALPYAREALEIEEEVEALNEKFFNVYRPEFRALAEKENRTPAEQERFDEVHKLMAEITDRVRELQKRGRELRDKMAEISGESLEEVRAYHKSIGLTFD